MAFRTLLQIIHYKGVDSSLRWHLNCPIDAKNIRDPRRYAHMGNLGPNHTIDESKAAVLLGLPLPDLMWFSRVLGVGHLEDTGNARRTVFTYEELKRLSSEAAASAK